MFTGSYDTPNEAYAAVVQALLQDGQHSESRVTDTVELHPAVIDIGNPGQRLITSYGRPVNPAFALAEVLWILTGRNDVAMLKWYNSTIDNYSDNGSVFNAAYGERLRMAFGFDQLDDIIRCLRDSPASRQAVMTIWDPRSDRAFNGAAKNTTKDRACNLVSHAMIRNGRLDWMQVMRSNDVIWGTPNNFMQWMHIQQWVARALDVPVGRYVHIADSLHMYDYHWREASNIQRFDLYAALGQDGHEPLAPSEQALERLSDIEWWVRGDIRPARAAEPLTGYWGSVADIFRAWRAYKDHNDLHAVDLLVRNHDRVLAAAQARFFYWWRWYKIDEKLRSDINQAMFDTWGTVVWHWIVDSNSSTVQPTHD